MLDRLHGFGYPTRRYIVYGQEWFLYVLNRLADQPVRVFEALADLAEAGAPGAAPPG